MFVPSRVRDRAGGCRDYARTVNQRALADLRAHTARLRRFSCFVSRRTPVVLHHCAGGSMRARGVHRGMGRKVSDYLVLPLHPDYHTGDLGIHKIGVETWESTFWPQAYLLDTLSRRLGYDVFDMAGLQP